MTREYLERIGKAWLGIVTFLRCFDTSSSSAKSSLALFGWFQRIFQVFSTPFSTDWGELNKQCNWRNKLNQYVVSTFELVPSELFLFSFSLPRNSFIYSLRIKWYLISANECLTHTIPTVDARGECRNDAKDKMHLFTYKIQIPLIYWSHYLSNNNN